MNLKKIVKAIGLGQSRADRMKRIRAKSTKLVFSDLKFELEKQQLLGHDQFFQRVADDQSGCCWRDTYAHK